MNIFELTESQKETKHLIGKITDHVNTFTRDAKEFNELMSMEHRTLQQSFTKLCLQWIEYIALDDYRTDGRNEQSHNLAKDILKAFGSLPRHEGTKPSEWLGCI